MDIFFTDPNEVRLPPEEVRLQNLQAAPSPDGRRVRVSIEVDPFLKRPDLDLWLLDAQGQEVAQTSIIQSMVRKLELTLHIREPQPASAYTLRVVLYATQMPEQPDPAQEMGGIQRTPTDEKFVTFDLPENIPSPPD